MLKVSQLFTPLLFLRLKNRDLALYQWKIPLCLAFLAWTVLFMSPLYLDVFGNKGLINSVNGLLVILAPFFIASLAAIASIPNQKLDEGLEGRGVELNVNRGGETEINSLTRRQFLCLLFGYNSFLSVMLYLGGEFALLLAPSIKEALPLISHIWVVEAFSLFYFILLFCLLVAALLGLHYLSERMHRK